MAASSSSSSSSSSAQVRPRSVATGGESSNYSSGCTRNGDLQTHNNGRLMTPNNKRRWQPSTTSWLPFSSLSSVAVCSKSHLVVAVISSVLTYVIISSSTASITSYHHISGQQRQHHRRCDNPHDSPTGNDDALGIRKSPSHSSPLITTTTTTTTTHSSVKSLASVIDDMMKARGDDVPVRTWQPKSFHCIPTHDTKLMERTPLTEGFLFQRPMKVGSTSFVGVVLRLVHRRMMMMMTMMMQHESDTDETDTSHVITNGRFCSYRAMHGSARRMAFDRRDGTKSFLMSLLRDPTSRAVSEFFHFVVSNAQVDPTDHNFQLTLLAPVFRPYASPPYFYNRYLLDLTCRNYISGHNNHRDDQDADDDQQQIDQLVMDELGITEGQLLEAKSSKPQSQNIEHATINSESLTIRQFGRPQDINYTQIVRDILHDYDFIGVTERMDESLVVLSYLMDLSLDEILYVKNPRASGGWGTHTADRPCIYVTPSFVSPGMERWFAGDTSEGGVARALMTQSSGGDITSRRTRSSRSSVLRPKSWPEMVYGDTLLHRAVNASLDATIDQWIGRDRFNERLQLFLYMKDQATQFCHKNNLIQPACDSGGNKIHHNQNTCYIWGEACDHVCLDSTDLKQHLSQLSSNTY